MWHHGGWKIQEHGKRVVPNVSKCSYTRAAVSHAVAYRFRSSVLMCFEDSDEIVLTCFLNFLFSILHSFIVYLCIFMYIFISSHFIGSESVGAPLLQLLKTACVVEIACVFETPYFSGQKNKA